jgi:hypothetical protein
LKCKNDAEVLKAVQDYLESKWKKTPWNIGVFSWQSL